MQRVGERYAYRLPDATARKDIEYYRDPKHRGYLMHTLKQRESPSLFFRAPAAMRRRKGGAATAAAKMSAENRLF